MFRTKPDPDTRKKIVLIGPMAAGKTTFKKVFFDQVNPLHLIENGLEPTIGIENKVYRYLDQLVGVWDLAGQEFNSWLDERKEVFLDTNLVIYMFDIGLDLKSIVLDLIRFLKVKKESCPGARLYILANKCDMMSDLDSYKKILTIEQIINAKAPAFANECNRGNFHRTSVVGRYFIRTMNLASRIIRDCLEILEVKIPKKIFDDFERDLRLLLSQTPGVWFSAQNIASRLGMTETEAKDRLENLVKIGFLDKRESGYYAVSSLGAYFVDAWKQEETKVMEKQMRENIGYFLNLRINKQEGNTIQG